MQNSIKITSMRCPDCGGAIEPEEGKRTTRCPYCNAVLHIEGIEDKGSDIRKASPSFEKNSELYGQDETVPKFVAFTCFDYIMLVLTVVGEVWTLWTTGNAIFMIMVAVAGTMLVFTRTIIRGELHKNNVTCKSKFRMPD